MRAGDRAWCALAVGVIGYDLSCPEGSTLSECVDDYLTHHPILTRLVIAILAAHLANVLNPRVDIIHLGFVGLRRLHRP